jgi:hypothetical protein
MGPVTIVFGAFLIVVGAGFYFGTEAKSVTALVPAIFGVLFVLLGALAAKNIARKHVMHFAAMLGLIGFALPIWRVIKSLSSGGEFSPAVIEQLVMAITCLVFVGLCVKSFIDARRNRQAASETTESAS